MLAVFTGPPLPLFTAQFVTHPHQGFGANKCRNEGAAVAKGDAFLFLDSGILLNNSALQHYRNLYEATPNCLIGGRYDWLPPMKITPADILGCWQDIVEGRLPRSQSWDRLELGGIVGIDPRIRKYPDFFDRTIQQFYFNYCLELYGGNLLVPREIFESLGGFDEKMIRHGGEDCEFAIRAQAANHPAVFSEEVVGYHIYHDRDQKQNAVDVLVNISYIRKKHDLVALGIVNGKDEQLPLIRKAREAKGKSKGKGKAKA